MLQIESPEALFLHVVRSDAPEAAVATAVLAWRTPLPAALTRVKKSKRTNNKETISRTCKKQLGINTDNTQDLKTPIPIPSS